MKPCIVCKISRPDAIPVAALGELGVATVHEAQGRSGLMRPYLRPIYPTAKIAGPAVTVICQPGDNLMIHSAIEVCEPGDVLVVTTFSESSDGMFGELLATSLQAHGVVGLVDRCRCPGCNGADRNAIPRLVKGDFRPRNRKSHRGLHQH